MTIVDTIADAHYGNRVALAMAFAALLNEEARALEADGVDVIQFDEPAFNVYMDAVSEWGVAALERAAEGLSCKTAVHICYGYGIQANIDWKGTLGAEWRQYRGDIPRAREEPDRPDLARVPQLARTDGADAAARRQGRAGRRDRCRDRSRRDPEEVADTIAEALLYVPAERLFPCTNCGMAPMRREVAEAKLAALGAGAALARRGSRRRLRRTVDEARR